MRYLWRKVICCLLVSAVLFAIFCLSGQSSVESNQLSGALARKLLELLPLEATAENLDVLNRVLRKLAHFTLYFALGGSLQCLFPAGKRSVPIVILLGLLFAALDEFHQSFTQRHASGWDVLLDTGGVAAGCLAAWVLRRKVSR